MRKIILITTLMVAICINQVRSQNSTDTEFLERPFQFTFLFPPLGTNGSDCGRYVNGFSLNLLIGHAAGVDGFEIGGLLNTEKAYVKGFQVSGFANLVGGYVNGGQVAGFLNINRGNTDGAQISGFLNIVDNTVSGLQLAGFCNIADRFDGGFQTAGFLNTFAYGFLNTQVAGFMNIAQKVNGAQIGGFMNIADFTEGIQIAGFSNVFKKGIVNTQIAGFMNVAEKVSGVQIGGFMNVAKHVKGVQVAGFLNICESIEGIPIGVINIVRDESYTKFEFSGSDVIEANVAFKLGLQRFYNIFSFGKLPDDMNRWAYGFGFGTETDISKLLSFNLEAISHQELWIDDHRVSKFLYIDRLNLLNQLKTNIAIRVHNLTIFGGPTVNVLVSNHNENFDDLAADLHPSSISRMLFERESDDWRDTEVKVWIGLNAGIRF